MARRLILLSLVLFIHSRQDPAQVERVLSPDRVTDWTKAGLRRGIPRHVDLEINIGVLMQANVRMNDDDVFALALEQARQFRKSRALSWVSLYFPPGTYTFRSSMTFDPARDSNLIIRGEGSEKTHLNFHVSSGNLIQITGTGPRTGPVALDRTWGFAKGSKSVKTASALRTISAGDFVEIRQANGRWIGTYDGGSGTPADNIAGQIVQVRSINPDGTVLELEDALRIDYWADLKPFVRAVDPIRNIGFENLTVNSLSRSTADGGPSNFGFYYAVDCWLWGVESSNAVTAHVAIGGSSHIEIRGCYFHESTSYGGGGHGYGVSIGGRSTNCLVENNVFARLRHAMIVSHAANGNVFGYNYSREQLDDNPTFPVHYPEGDMSIHGHYPFANLFEGNCVTYIVADNWWGDNGPYNTFFRNLIDPEDIVLERTDYANVVGNELGSGLGAEYEGGLTFDANRDYGSNAETIVDVYGFIQEPDGTIRPLTHSEAAEAGETSSNIFLNDVSYYLAAQPEFLRGYSWPPLGPALRGGMAITQSIPAKDRWNSAVKTDAAPPLAVAR